jgi:DNA-directed RNA polymerase specialized sigma24 family protein
VIELNVNAAIASAANEVARRFRGFVERDDLMQEGWLWTVLHPYRLKTYVDDEQFKRAEYRLRVDLTSAMDRYARQQKAQALGYDLQDEYAYGVAQVTGLLDYALRGVLVKPVDATEAASAKTDPAEGGNFTTMVLDVKQAWETADLSELERDMLKLHILSEASAAEIGRRLGVSRQEAASQLRRALRRLVAALGGIQAKGCPYDCECHEGRLRLRPGVHSAISGANQLAS